MRTSNSDGSESATRAVETTARLSKALGGRGRLITPRRVVHTSHAAFGYLIRAPRRRRSMSRAARAAPK